MEFHEYQELSKKTVDYPLLGPPRGRRVPWIYPALGLAGETGEIVEKVKKLVRDANLEVTLDQKNGIRDELGDLLWYMAQMATGLGISLDEVATSNLAKLSSRSLRGTVRGQGDSR